MGKKTVPVSDAKKLATMLGQLNAIKKELLPDDEIDRERIEEIKKFDEFQKKKHDLNSLLNSIREDMLQLDEIRQKSKDPKAGATEIRLKNQNTKRLQESKILLAELEMINSKEKNKKRKNPEEADTKKFTERENLCRLLKRELEDLANRNTGVKVSMTQDEQNMVERHKTRTEQEKEDRRNARLGKKNAKRRSSLEGKHKNMKVDIFEEDFRDMVPASQQEQAFLDQVHVNEQEQEHMLDMIGANLDELKEIAVDMNKNLQFQNDMIPELNNKIDDLNTKMETANNRLIEIFEESGGMTRWCPMCVCLIILLALVGYIVNMFV